MHMERPRNNNRVSVLERGISGIIADSHTIDETPRVVHIKTGEQTIRVIFPPIIRERHFEIGDRIQILPHQISVEGDARIVPGEFRVLVQRGGEQLPFTIVNSPLVLNPQV